MAGNWSNKEKIGTPVHHRGFEQKAPAARSGQIAQLAVGMNDGAFVRGDGVGSMFEGGADVVDGGLAGFDVERSGLEENIRASSGQPFPDVAGVWGGHSCPPTAGSRIRI